MTTTPLTECDGHLFKEALLGSLAWLTLNRDEVDALNVFPVRCGVAFVFASIVC